MVRNKLVPLPLVAILMALSFGFTTFKTIRSGSGSAYSAAVKSLPAVSSNLIPTIPETLNCGNEADIFPNINCSEDDSSEPDADENLDAVKVSPQLAGVCALHKQPAGTTVINVVGVYAELSFPYYKVTLNTPNGSQPIININATNCEIIPAP